MIIDKTHPIIAPPPPAPSQLGNFDFIRKFPPWHVQRAKKSRNHRLQ
jgi:hypothetical protein